MTKTPKPLTLKRAKKLIDQVVTIRGADFVYQRPGGNRSNGPCFYVHKEDTDQPEIGCGVGLALYLHGAPLDNLLRVNNAVSGTLLLDLKHQGLLPDYDIEAAKFLRAFQSDQDNGATYADARKAALAAIE